MLKLTPSVATVMDRSAIPPTTNNLYYDPTIKTILCMMVTNLCSLKETCVSADYETEIWRGVGQKVYLDK